MFQNLLRQIKVVLYRLKRSFGLPMIYRRRLSDTYDLETGALTAVVVDIPIRRGILMPLDQVRKFAYDLTYIAANKNFTYGGFFDKLAKVVILEQSDLPRHFQPNLNDFIIIDSVEYCISKMELSEQNVAWVIGISSVTEKPLVEQL